MRRAERACCTAFSVCCKLCIWLSVNVGGHESTSVPPAHVISHTSKVTLNAINVFTLLNNKNIHLYMWKPDECYILGSQNNHKHRRSTAWPLRAFAQFFECLHVDPALLCKLLWTLHTVSMMRAEFGRQREKDASRRWSTNRLSKYLIASSSYIIDNCIHFLLCRLRLHCTLASSIIWRNSTTKLAYFELSLNTLSVSGTIIPFHSLVVLKSFNKLWAQ